MPDKPALRSFPETTKLPSSRSFPKSGLRFGCPGVGCYGDVSIPRTLLFQCVFIISRRVIPILATSCRLVFIVFPSTEFCFDLNLCQTFHH